MTTETTKLKAKLDSLTASLSGLESTLAPLFAQTLPETTVALTPIEQAKLQTLLPYLVYDLVFIYLKSKGIDPKTHPVVGELSRVRKYFDKISSAENPETPRAPLDKAAAARFIKHAITQSKVGEASADADATAPSPPSTFVPTKVTSKMAERAEYEAAMRARGDESSEEDELEIIGEAEEPAPPPPAQGKGKGKGKAMAVVEEPETVSAGSKRRRPVIDPFAGSGFGDDEPPSSQPDEVEDADKKKKRKKEKKKPKKSDADAGSAKSPKKKARK
ncbi:Sas10/Utp3/C1D family-domain-containing protein [Mycena belliarum]|uniref:Exosome complex protein n=1 Tax=Mycena belliarum TaxID=1033014 RepID=A0AAD6UIV2_9AGAR|nr:Sas10/Utp3/C1D family-domain-containing protein [Mycena belliae]